MVIFPSCLVSGLGGDWKDWQSVTCIGGAGAVCFWLVFCGGNLENQWISVEIYRFQWKPGISMEIYGEIYGEISPSWDPLKWPRMEMICTYLCCEVGKTLHHLRFWSRSFQPNLQWRLISGGKLGEVIEANGSNMWRTGTSPRWVFQWEKTRSVVGFFFEGFGASLIPRRYDGCGLMWPGYPGSK